MTGKPLEAKRIAGARLTAAFLAGAVAMFLLLNHMFEGLIWMAVKRLM